MYTTIKVNMERVDIDNSVFGLSLSTCNIFVSLAGSSLSFFLLSRPRHDPPFIFTKTLINQQISIVKSTVW